MKVNEEDHMVHIKADENNIQGVYEFGKKCVDVEESTESVIGVFVNNKLRIVDKKKDFILNNNAENK